MSKFTNCVGLQSLRIIFITENSADPDEMLPSAAFHLGLHCFSKYSLGVSSVQRANPLTPFMLGMCS